MNILELHASSTSFGEVAREQGHSVESHLLEHFNEPSSLVRYDLIWFSPPCKGFSVASIGTHWGGGKGGYLPITEVSLRAIENLELILKVLRDFSHTFYVIENPRGLMRKMGQMQDFPRRTVTYCQYGDNRMKPTDIWSNIPKWVSRPMCSNGDPCHQSAPRGSRRGSQGLKTKAQKAKIPRELCIEILESCELALLATSPRKRR